MRKKNNNNNNNNGITFDSIQMDRILFYESMDNIFSHIRGSTSVTNLTKNLKTI